MGNPLSYLHDQLESWRKEGTYQRLRVLESECAPESRFDGKGVINLASNNYEMTTEEVNEIFADLEQRLKLVRKEFDHRLSVLNSKEKTNA